MSSHGVGLAGLACATTYHYRVSSADAAGNRATGADRTFTTGACPPPPPSDTSPPVLSGVAASAGVGSATVSWLTDEPADSRVEYGLSSGYGLTQSAAALVSSHGVGLAGLACATTYHYRVSSADAAGNRATGADRTLTTSACPPDSGTLRSDEFNGGALNDDLWGVFDPLGDTLVSQTSGRLRVSVPLGTAHDLWEGALNAPRVLQSAVDADFEVEARYDSPVTEPFQMQGLVAQTDFNDLVRFDVYSSGGDTRLFAATFSAGARPFAFTKQFRAALLSTCACSVRPRSGRSAIP